MCRSGVEGAQKKRPACRKDSGEAETKANQAWFARREHAVKQRGRPQLLGTEEGHPGVSLGTFLQGSQVPVPKSMCAVHTTTSIDSVSSLVTSREHRC